MDVRYGPYRHDDGEDRAGGGLLLGMVIGIVFWAGVLILLALLL